MNKYFILFFCFFAIKLHAQNNIPTPGRLNIKTFQRELELHWDKADEHTHFEVLLNNKLLMFVQTNSCIIDGLNPGTRYEIKIRAVKKGVYSAYTPVRSIYTESITKREDDPTRVPHLRTLLGSNINIAGNYPQNLQLYYNDLYSGAQINYYINGEQVQPTNNSLYFRQKGVQILKIIIREASDREWELEYKINIK